MLLLVAQVSNPGEVLIRQAAAEEMRQAMAMVLSVNGKPAEDSQVGEFFRLTAQRGIDLRNVSVAVAGGRIVWGLLPIPSPGKTLLLLSPNFPFEAGASGAAERLVRATCEAYAARGCLLAQTLLDPGAQAVRATFRAIGFREMAELNYLNSPVRRLKHVPVLPGDLEFDTYSPQTHDLFALAIRESYENSLDCPALNGMREIDDVIDGHRAAGQVSGDGQFDPRLWRVIVTRQAPRQTCGVLLLCRTDPTDVMEIVYLGVSPAFRRRGLGTLLLRHALASAAEDRRKRVSLAVDAKNQPALELYYRHGFQKIGSKIAMIKTLQPAETRPVLQPLADVF